MENKPSRIVIAEPNEHYGEVLRKEASLVFPKNSIEVINDLEEAEKVISEATLTMRRDRISHRIKAAISGHGREEGVDFIERAKRAKIGNIIFHEAPKAHSPVNSRFPISEEQKNQFIVDGVSHIPKPMNYSTTQDGPVIRHWLQQVNKPQVMHSTPTMEEFNRFTRHSYITVGYFYDSRVPEIGDQSPKLKPVVKAHPEALFAKANFADLEKSTGAFPQFQRNPENPARKDCPGRIVVYKNGDPVAYFDVNEAFLKDGAEVLTTTFALKQVCGPQ